MINMRGLIEDWIEFQNLWIRFTSIFSYVLCNSYVTLCSNPEIQKELRSEHKRFESSDMHWRTVMKQVHGIPRYVHITYLLICRILSVAERNELQPMFQREAANLEKILKSMNAFLDIKRQLFPRFCFLSNTELLDMVTQQSSFQVFLPKMFEGIHSLQIETENDEQYLVAMVSQVLLLIIFIG